MAKKKTSKKKDAEKKAPPSNVVVPEIKLVKSVFIIEGVSELLTRKMPAIIKTADKSEEYKDEDEFNKSIYWNDGKPGLPPIAFKHAAVSACRSLKKTELTMVLAAQTHHVTGAWVPVKGKPHARTDIVRVPPGSSNAVPRVRAEFWPWEVEIEIIFNSAVIRLDQLVALYNLAGFAVGVFEYRPEKGGTCGMYKVKKVRS